MLGIGCGWVETYIFLSSSFQLVFVEDLSILLGISWCWDGGGDLFIASFL